MDVVASYRAKAYCDHLSKYGIKPTLLTHRWEETGTEYRTHQANDKIVVEEAETCSIIRLPRPENDRSPSKLHTLWCYINSDLDVGLLGSYRVFREFLSMHLAQKKYDLIIAIYNPHFHLKLAYECFRRFGIPYVLDFRDLWNNEIVTSSYQPGLRERVINSIIARAWRRWLKSSLFFSTTGNKWCRFLRDLSDKEGIIVRNGFDYLPVSRPQSSGSKRIFKVVHFGRLYQGQNLDVFLEGFRQFAKRFPPSEVKLEMIGLKKIRGFDFEGLLRKALGEYVTFIPYLPKSELMAYCENEAAIFFLPAFKEDNGQFCVKAFDYILAGKNVLVAPASGEVSEFVTRVNAGVALNTPTEVWEYLEKCHAEFTTTGSVSFHIEKKILPQFTREAQVKLMADKIREGLSGRA
jgi:glycosyltransferase involved in cell wall biosynthesis